MSAFSTLSRLFSRTDEEAMCRVKEHDDPHEFARLLGRWEDPVRRLCTRMTGEADRGEDLVQEVFLRLFETRKTYQPASRFSTFLWRIALNRCYDELRRQQRRREFLAASEADPGTGATADAPADGPGPDLQAAALEESRLVRHAVMQLPDIYRIVIVLRHYQGLKLACIAEILEIPEGTVNSRMAEALARLGQMLAPKFNGVAQSATVDRRRSSPRPSIPPDPALKCPGPKGHPA